VEVSPKKKLAFNLNCVHLGINKVRRELLCCCSIAKNLLKIELFVISEAENCNFFNTCQSSRLEKFLQPDHRGILNAPRTTKRAVLLKKLVQQGHKVKEQNVYLPTQCKKTNSLPCSGV
jgi:hypothetical protein